MKHATLCGTPFPDFTALERYLDGLGLFRMSPGLERVRAVLERLELRRPPFFVVQVVGTNGKGSTCTMLAELAREHGLKAGLHTSPHFLSVRERVRLDGEPLSEARWVALAAALMRRGGEDLSYFEFVTCLAVLAFAEAGVDLAVMETGLGGRYDATTALEADLVLFTPIGLDHQSVLGTRLRDIAADKAGAMRQGVPALICAQHPEAWEELARAARERGVPAREISPAEREEAGGFALGLAGEHQRENAALALAAWRVLREALAPRAWNDPEQAERRALARAFLPGRMQRVPAASRAPGATGEPGPPGWPPLLLDGAHNSHGLAALGHSLAREGTAPAAVIFSCLRDKDPEQLLPHLRALAAAGPIFVPPIRNNPRAGDPGELAAMIGLAATPCASLQEALEKASSHIAERLPECFSEEHPQTPLLICGSLYLLAEVYAMRPDLLRALT